jgi:hypothetical protein
MLLQRLWADWLRRREEWAAMLSRRIELVCGVLAGALGLTALGVVLFALLQVQGLEILWLPITLWGGLWLGVVLCAVWHSLVGSRPALVLLWVYTALLCLATTPALIDPIGIVFVPADVLALGASIAGTVAAQRRIPAHM